jgi:hypothetical protein
LTVVIELRLRYYILIESTLKEVWPAEPTTLMETCSIMTVRTN